MDYYCIHNDICSFCVGIISVATDLITNNTLIGALGIKVQLALTMLKDTTLYYIDPNRRAYFFIITMDGFVLMHPMVSKFTTTSRQPVMIHIRYLEREAYLNGIIDSMTRYGLIYSMWCGSIYIFR